MWAIFLSINNLFTKITAQMKKKILVISQFFIFLGGERKSKKFTEIVFFFFVTWFKSNIEFPKCLQNTSTTFF